MKSETKKNTCLNCNKQFIPSWNRPNQSYCSHNCRVSYYARKIRGGEKRGTKANCTICGGEFSKHNKQNIYCSQKCANIGRYRKSTSTEDRKEQARIFNQKASAKRRLNGKAQEVERRYRKTPKGIVKSARRRNLKASLPVTLTAADWQAALNFFDNKCAYCGDPLTKANQEHFIPLSKQGGYTKSNIVPACPSCNSRKNAHNPLDWLVMQPKGIVAYVKVTQYLAHEKG